MMFNGSKDYADDLQAENSLTALDDLAFDAVFKTVMRRVYLWMALGLAMTTGAALATVMTPFGSLVFSNVAILMGLVFGELALVIILSAGINKLSTSVAGVLFFLYAALNGITLSSIFLVYELGSIGGAFLVAATLFGAMSLIGYSTKKDLTQWRSYLLMGLIGLVMASVVNIFFASSGLDWMISIIGVVLFLGLTIYDTQHIKRMTAQSMQIGDEAVVAKVGILGALRLYLDFVNLFLYLLRFMGRRRR
jgi:FtsH-binding integral membrane protein